MTRTVARAPGGRTRHRLSMFDLKASPYIYIAPFFVLFAIVGLFPLIYTINVAMHEWDLLKGQGEFVGGENFVEILGDEMFWNSIGNTLSIFLLSAIPQLTVALTKSISLLSQAGSFGGSNVQLRYSRDW